MKLKRSGCGDLHSWLELSVLFNGKFLPDYPYEEFLVTERERMTSYQKDVVLNIARAYAQNSDVNRALIYYNRAIELDSYDEDTYYELIEILLDNNALVKARAIGDKMKLHIEDEMGISCAEQLQSMFDYYSRHNK